MQVIVDCEASGPCIGKGQLVSFAAVTLCGREFKSPIFDVNFSCSWQDEAYQSFGYSRTQHMQDHADGKTVIGGYTMGEFLDFLGPDKHTFWSDNPAFDWQWISYEFGRAGFDNPFGHSARRIGDLYAGAAGKWRDQRGWKKWRKTPHTHDPLDDARGNAEALRHILEKFFA